METAIRSDLHDDIGNPVGHVPWDTTEHDIARHERLEVGRDGKASELFFKPGPAEHIRERST